MLRTVYIIGAGANTEVNMPDGLKLVKDIINLYSFRVNNYSQIDSGDKQIRETAIKLLESKNVKSNDAIIEYINKYKESLVEVTSIDRYIKINSEKKLEGLFCKLGISKSILDAERNSKLKNYNIRDNEDIRERTWYEPFFNLIQHDYNFDDLSTALKSITIIDFNYDRCINYYLFYKLKKVYNESDELVRNKLKELTVISPYGKLGDITEMKESNDNELYFGEYAASCNELDKISKRIVTYSENSDITKSNIDKCHRALANANRIIFLGYHFHKQNDELLFKKNVLPSDLTKPNPDLCYGTAYKIEKERLDVIKKRLIKNSMLDEKRINLFNLTCKSFFDRYYDRLYDEDDS
jgi:hypothetical protein